MMTLSEEQVSQRLELSLWKAEATARDVERLCAEAVRRKVRGVCVCGSRVEMAASFLSETELKVTCLVGFPFGAMDADVKRYEAEAAIDCGAQEIEMVINVGRLKDGDRRYVLRELRDIAEAADERPVKVALETQLLSREEMLLACELVLDSGVHFVSTGSGLKGSTDPEDVKLIREAVGPKFGVKVIGDLRQNQSLITLISAGASVFGASLEG